MSNNEATNPSDVKPTREKNEFHERDEENEKSVKVTDERDDSEKQKSLEVVASNELEIVEVQNFLETIDTKSVLESLKKSDDNERTVSLNENTTVHYTETKISSTVPSEVSFDDDEVSKVVREVEAQNKKVEAMKSELMSLWKTEPKTQNQIELLKDLQTRLVDESFKLKTLIEQALEVQKLKSRKQRTDDHDK